ncbi:MAG: hypothetical protein ACTSP3_07650 [Candidatus Heimdallarchaeaceae archaeon]
MTLRTMDWKMVFKIYEEGKEGRKIELTRNKLRTVEDIKFFLKEYFEEESIWGGGEERGKGWGCEIVVEDSYGREVKIKKLVELMEKKEEMLGAFALTTRAIGEIIQEG